jgi:hypothetical protein
VRPPASRRSTRFQDPELTGFSATDAYLPAEKVSVSVAVTYGPAAFDAQGNYANSADAIFRWIGGVVAPKDPPPTVPGGLSPRNPEGRPEPRGRCRAQARFRLRLAQPVG